MGMPKIPEGTYRPTFEELIIDLLESIALDNMSMAHILNAEGEKLQEFISKYCTDEISYCQLISSCHDTNNLINNLIMKDWLLLSRLHTIEELNEKNYTTNHCV